MKRRVVLITGASSGIGAELGRVWGREGCDVALLARRADRLEEAAAAVRSVGARALPLVCDVTDRHSVGEAVARTVETLGPIDIAVANAGVALKCRASKFNLADAETIIRVNVLGMFNLYDAVIPAMLQRREGHFVGIASLAGLRGLPGSPVYSASKAAMQAFLEGARGELSVRGVKLVTVNPGFVKSEITRTNEFAMPFLMETEDAAERIVRGVERGERTIEFPLPMKLAVRTMRALPDRVWDFFSLRAARGRAKGSQAPSSSPERP
jgi:short-subunit dehydrogenase